MSIQDKPTSELLSDFNSSADYVAQVETMGGLQQSMPGTGKSLKRMKAIAAELDKRGVIRPHGTRFGL